MRQKYGENLIVIRALTESGLQAVMKVEGATDGDASRAYVQQARCRALKAGDVIILDNLRAHKVQGIREAIESKGAEVIYLPPYWPALKPIEQC